MELIAQLSSLFIHVQNLLSLCFFQGDMPDGMHKSAEGCETNPTYIAAKKAKHLEDSKTTQNLVLMQCSSYLRLTVRQAHRIRCLNQFDFFSPKF